MSSQGPNFPTTGADDATVGTSTWTNPGNITADDGVFATRGFPTLSSAQSHYLKATGLGFTIADGNTIVGIVVDWKVSVTSDVNNPVTDASVKIVKGGTIGGTEESLANTFTTAIQYWPYPLNTTTDLWGQTWTPADIRSATFGAVFSAIGSGGSGSNTCQVDACRITVYYTPAVTDTYPAPGSQHLSSTIRM